MDIQFAWCHGAGRGKEGLGEVAERVGRSWCVGEGGASERWVGEFDDLEGCVGWGLG